MSKEYFLKSAYMVSNPTNRYNLSNKHASDAMSYNLQFCERLRLETREEHKSLCKLLKNIFNQISSFHQRSIFNGNYNRFWAVHNSYHLIEKMNINNNKNDTEISTFDFSTL